MESKFSLHITQLEPSARLLCIPVVEMGEGKVLSTFRLLFWPKCNSVNLFQTRREISHLGWALVHWATSAEQLFSTHMEWQYTLLDPIVTLHNMWNQPLLFFALKMRRGVLFFFLLAMSPHLIIILSNFSLKLDCCFLILFYLTLITKSSKLVSSQFCFLCSFLFCYQKVDMLFFH